jgi:hypothetical protein
MSAEKANTKRAGVQSRISTGPAWGKAVWPWGLKLSIFAEGVGSLAQRKEQWGE